MFGPTVMGWIPVKEACWAISTDGSMTRELGLGRMEVRFWTADVRRSEVGREGAGAAIVVFLWVVRRIGVGDAELSLHI